MNSSSLYLIRRQTGSDSNNMSESIAKGAIASRNEIVLARNIIEQYAAKDISEALLLNLNMITMMTELRGLNSDLSDTLKCISNLISQNEQNVNHAVCALQFEDLVSATSCASN